MVFANIFWIVFSLFLLIVIQTNYRNSVDYSHVSSSSLSNLSAPTEKHSYNFTWTLITTIACKEAYDESNILAFKSWRKLRPKPQVVYFSTCHPNFATGATTIMTFDRTVTGLPLFGDMMAFSERVSTELVAWTNADILLSSDVVAAIDHLHSSHLSQHSLWMAVAARWDLSSSTSGSNLIANLEDAIFHNTLKRFLRQRGILHTQGKLN